MFECLPHTHKYTAITNHGNRRWDFYLPKPKKILALS